jgi:hypothetical protein
VCGALLARCLWLHNRRRPAGRYSCPLFPRPLSSARDGALAPPGRVPQFARPHSTSTPTAPNTLMPVSATMMDLCDCERALKPVVCTSKGQQCLPSGARNEAWTATVPCSTMPLSPSCYTALPIRTGPVSQSPQPAALGVTSSLTWLRPPLMRVALVVNTVCVATSPRPVGRQLEAPGNWLHCKGAQPQAAACLTLTDCQKPRASSRRWSSLLVI